MNHLRTFLLAAAVLSLAACQPKTAGQAAAPDTTPAIASVNGSPISRGFYEFYIKGITGKPAADLPAQMRGQALDNLIRARVVSDEAHKEGVDSTTDIAYMLQLSRLQVLEQAMQDRYLKDRPATEAELRAEYETQIGQMSKIEYHTRNILVATEPFADQAVKRLEKGEKFEEVAKSVSMDPSKANGGDLPWMSADRMPAGIRRRGARAQAGRVHPQAVPHPVRLARGAAGGHARRRPAAVRSGASAPGTGGAGEEVPRLHG